MSAQLEASSPQRWSTDQVDRRRALAYWVDTVCDRFLELEIDTPLRQGFRARLVQVPLGAATMNLVEAEMQRVQRTRAKIAHSRYPVSFLLQLRRGRMRLRQLGRETLVNAGESVFIDGTEPYEIECPLPTSALALRLPEPWLIRWIANPERIGGRLFNGGGWSATLNAALASLDVDSCGQLALSSSLVAEQIAVLIALAVGPETQVKDRPNLLDGLRRSLHDRLHEADLTPAAVASEHRISKRSLHYAFARAGTTFTEDLVRLRLERASEMLSDPRLADLAVSEVAVRCGFADPSHFARRFRRQFAQPPLQARRAAVRGRH